MNVAIVIPAHNEEAVIEPNLRRVFSTLPELLANDSFEIVVVENDSTDRTGEVVRRLTREFPNLRLMTTQARGKGQAIRSGWLQSDADAYAFMDADLSADLEHFPRLLDALADADVAIGSRRHPEAEVERSVARTVLSRAYNIIARASLGIPISDLQCGFKAVRRHVVLDLVPKTEHAGYFFDTELLALAHREDYRIVEVPIRWSETTTRGRTSRVNVPKTSWELFQNLWKLRRRLRTLSS
jgi:glycosyltransferase involved in cell wall biosynthesis